jgi:hypothetical protein
MSNEDKKEKNLAHRRCPPSKEMILIAPNKLNRQVAGGQAASTPRKAETSSEFLGVLRVLGGFIHSLRRA